MLEHRDIGAVRNVEFDPGVPVGLFTFVALQRFLGDVLGSRIDLATPAALRPEMREQILASLGTADEAQLKPLVREALRRL